MKTLARKPTDGELEKFQSYLSGAANRNEAYEDLLWPFSIPPNSKPNANSQETLSCLCNL